MQQSLSAMKTALRVLTAITERQVPAREDVEELRQAVPNGSSLPNDELACEAIQIALRRRAEVRRAGQY
jgi:hypothetical protein